MVTYKYYDLAGKITDPVKNFLKTVLRMVPK